jgi:hypothetical protein
VGTLFDALAENLREEQLPHIEDSFRRHRLEMDLRLLARLRNQAEIGPEIESLELADMAVLLGRRPAGVGQGHRALDALVRAAGPDMDEPLLRYFYRHARREEALMQGGMGRAANARASAIRWPES